MNTKNLTAACSVIAMAMSVAVPAIAFDTPPDETCFDCPEEPAPKGNNGWGNGTDAVNGVGGTNAGSNSGGTAGTKSINGTGPDKFEGKFDGR